MKSAILAAIGTVGSFIAAALGGWDAAIITLIIFMGIDLATGFIVSIVFKKSHKTESGAFSSAIGWKGLCKKCMVILLIVVANRLDMQIGASYVRDGVCIAFMINEAMSIIENAGLMGVPIPKVITNVLDLLKNKQEGTKNE